MSLATGFQIFLYFQKDKHNIYAKCPECQLAFTEHEQTLSSIWKCIGKIDFFLKNKGMNITKAPNKKNAMN